jgi:poly [ADP-ribose] polymerase
MTTSTVERLIFTDLASNGNKYWEIEQDGTTVVTRWGRVGATKGQSKSFSFTSEDAATNFFAKKIKEKNKKGYSKQRTVAASTDGDVAVAVAPKVKIEHAGDKATSDLIDFLVKRNIHTIEGLTSVRMEAGRLTTPLGPVTAEGLDEAQQILMRMTGTRSKSELGDLANQYMRIIPRNIGMRRVDPSDLFGTADKIQSEQATVDALRAVVDDLADKAKQATDSDPVAFETKLELVDPTDPEFARVNGLFLKSQNRQHQSHGMKLRRAWRMSIAAQEAAFETNLTPVWELWHATKDVNLLSILKGGFIIPKRNQGIAITGRMYGDGVYFSDQSTKALNYVGGMTWGGEASQRPFMLLSDVAMGKSFMATRGFSGGCPKGYDSTFAKAGTAVRNNEMIVYRTSQIRAKFLCEFSL